ncbi:peptide chain release factor N(5)-glutamine methyltransferase [Ramlibacter sp. AW1]|uniref:Release factor glutamine methyltransferase n=1 Tax=Ramlibacter aurantiacus TaxID=2801330 RepID=A0A937D3M1_9BURK|nr:peptide chain release factor N(5)-glutamine methyltransferase [Ramlibacter aurantiacus]
MEGLATVAGLLREAATRGVDRLDAQLLLLRALGRDPQDRAWLIAHDGDPVAAPAHAAFEALCARRSRGEPAAYLLGRKEFFGLPLQVDARVLVPRPDTETLVEWSLEVLSGWAAPRVIDLGTGSGAIALAIKHRRPDAWVQAVDRSAEAVEVASGNAARLGLEVRVAQADWLEGAGSDWQLVVSNPPYVEDEDPHLAALAHEPLQALVSGPDGLRDIRGIVAAAPEHLARGGWLLLEHGWNQAEAVRELLRARGFTQVTSRRDLAGIERCSGGQWNA